MAEINDILGTAPLTTDPVTVADKAGLGQDAFLRIFLAQLEHQDPFEPQDSSELGAQLAQFSQLEQSLQMTKELKGINSRLDELISASSASGAALLDRWDEIILIPVLVDQVDERDLHVPEEPQLVQLWMIDLQIPADDRHGHERLVQ